MRGEGDRCGRGVTGIDDVACHCHRVGKLEGLDHLVNDAGVCLVRDERAELVGGDTGGFECLLGDLRHFPYCPAEDGGAVLAQGGPDLFAFFDGVCGEVAVADVQQGVSHTHSTPTGAVRTPHSRCDTRLVGDAYNCCACAVAEQEGDGAFGVVDEVRELLNADDQHVLCGACADEGVCLGDAVAETCTRCGDVVCRALGADCVGDQGCQGGGCVGVRDGRDDDRLNVLTGYTGCCQGVLGGTDGKVGDRLVFAGAVAGCDAGALLDPLVGGVDCLNDVVVGDDDLTAGCAVTEDAGVAVDFVLLEGSHVFNP